MQEGIEEDAVDLMSFYDSKCGGLMIAGTWLLTSGYRSRFGIMA